MGEVYTARDLHLDRDVAIKVLPEGLAHDHSRLERFRREAQLLAALNHPNIATIHGLEESDGALFLVMELVLGHTLAERVHGGRRLPLDEALNICSQLAQALNAAHQRGITHRDVKPANVKVTPEGRVKILDFGLAKSLVENDTADRTPTMTAMTAPGIVLGTPAYMSPEQVRGEPAGTQADIWAFGCVLYELLSGRAPFAASTFAEIIAAVLMSQPDWHALPADTPRSVRNLLRRCLDKEAHRRVQEIRDAHAIIERARQGRSTEVAPPRDRSVTSLAVLPFVNGSGDPQMDYLSDGLTESIILSLSQLPQLRVTAQSSVFRYRGQSDRAIEIGRELGVTAVLTGKVQQRAQTLRISVELADVEDGWQIWGAQYRRKADDIFDAEESITREISENLRLKLSREHSQILARRYTENVEAYHLYLKGRFYWGKRTQEGLTKSLEYFRQAIESDPTYALAYGGLAEGYLPQGYYCHLPPTEAFPRARAAAERALEIDPGLSEARTVIAMVKSYEWDSVGAEADARAAIEQSSRYPRAYQALAECLTMQGRFGEAVVAIKEGLDLDPLSLYMNAAVVMTYYFTQQFEAAVTHGQVAIEMDRTFYPLHFYLGLAYQQNGQLSNAVTELEDARRLSANSTLMMATLGGALAAADRGRDARGVLRELDDVGTRRYVPQVFVAAIHAALGETDRALSCLERARKDRCCWLLRCLRFDARFDGLREEPRFKALLQAASPSRP
jgi:serine/threonine protein kinase/Flp pilus assembly protein TadD